MRAPEDHVCAVAVQHRSPAVGDPGAAGHARHLADRVGLGPVLRRAPLRRCARRDHEQGREERRHQYQASHLAASQSGPMPASTASGGSSS